MLYLTSCEACKMLSEKETADDCRDKKASNEYNECCYTLYYGKYYNHRVFGNKCIEVPKTMDLESFVKEKEAYFSKDKLKFNSIRCSNRMYHATP